MSLALATRGVISGFGGGGGGEVPVYYCIDLPEVFASKNVSPKLTAQNINVKVVMGTLGPHIGVDNLSAEEYIEDLIPKLIIK